VAGKKSDGGCFGRGVGWSLYVQREREVPMSVKLLEKNSKREKGKN